MGSERRGRISLTAELRRTPLSWGDALTGEERTPRGGEGAILVHVRLGGESGDESEFRALARSAGAEVVAELQARRERPDARSFIGRGKVEALRDLCAAHEVDVVLFDHDLSPSQEKNLERALGRRVLDRTGLILDIFAQRARSHEGKLQVELAQLRRLSTRLVRGWTHLERQKGGIGLRGPGETQLETDRRLIGVRIKQIRRRLERVRCHRSQGRRARRRAEVPTVSIVGYTNAGKSTLFNTLSGAGVYARDQLFATLDPTLRRLDLEGVGAVVIADTVGFVRELPHELVAAFQATLEETCEADLLLHVVDVSDPDWESRRQQVHAVLQQIGADGVPMLEVRNKIDRCPGLEARIDTDEAGRPRCVWLSAHESDHMPLLYQALGECLGGGVRHCTVRLPFSAAAARSRLYRHGLVMEETVEGERGWRLSLALPADVRADLLPPEAELLEGGAGEVSLATGGREP